MEEIGVRDMDERCGCRVAFLRFCVLKVAGLAQIRRERDDVWSVGFGRCLVTAGVSLVKGLEQLGVVQ